MTLGPWLPPICGAYPSIPTYGIPTNPRCMIVSLPRSLLSPRFALLSVCATVLLAAATASADGSTSSGGTTPYSEPGFYAGLSGSVGVALGLENDVSVTRFRGQAGRNDEHGLVIDSGVGLHARVGYRLHPRVSVEAQFEWIAEWSVDGRDTQSTNPTSAVDVARAEAWTLTANVKSYAATGRVQPYLVGGVGLMRFQAENRSPLIQSNSRRIFELNIDGFRGTDFALRVGGGLDIYFTERLSLVVGSTYVIPFGRIDSYDYLSVEWGMQYRF